MRVAVCLLALAGGVTTTYCQPMTLQRIEYTRIDAAGDEAAVVADESGRVTGSVRPRGEAEVRVESWLHPDPPALAELAAVGFWEAPAADALAAGEVGVRLEIRWEGRARTVVLRAGDLAARPELAEALPVLEADLGLAPFLADVAKRRGTADLEGGRWKEAIAVLRSGCERLAGGMRVIGPPTTLPADADLPDDRLRAVAEAFRDELARLRAIAGAVVEAAERARHFPDESLWPQEWRPAWPWEWKAPAAGFEERMLSLRLAPTEGIRYGTPAAWPAPEPDGETTDSTFGAPAAVRLGRQQLPSVGADDPGALEFAIATTESDLDALAWLGARFRAEGISTTRRVVYGRERSLFVDLMGWKDGRVVRRIAVQSGKRVALARLEASREAYRRSAHGIAALLASIEPRPLGADRCVGAMRAVLCPGTRVDVPGDWGESRAGGAPPDADFRDFRPSAAPDLVLALRCYPQIRSFDWNGFFRSLAHPASTGANPKGIQDVVGNDVILEVRPRTGAAVYVRLSRVSFGPENVPVLWFGMSMPDRMVAGAVIVAGDDGERLMRARRLATLVAASVE